MNFHKVMPFRLQRKDFFLTYSQCNGSPQELLDKFKEENHLRYIIVGQEHHQDGNLHLHAFLLFSKLKDIRNERYFDFNGCHPNIRLGKTTSIQDTIAYCEKEGFVVVEYGERPQEQDSDDLYALARGMEREQFFNYCRRKRYAYQYAMDAWNTTQQVSSTIHAEDPIEGTYNEFLNWYDAPIAGKPTVIVGATGIGKTVYAISKCAKPALFCSHIDDLKQLRANYHKSIIFDDMCFKHWHIQAQIHIVDVDRKRSVNVKHTIVGIPAGIEKWFTCNEYPFSENDFGAIRRRINFVNLY